MRVRLTIVLATLALLAGLALAQNVNRSGSYKVGDTVEVWLNVNGPHAWVPCTVLQIQGDDVEVHYGGGRYNKKWVKLADLRNEAREQAQARDAERVKAFWAEVDPRYLEPIQAWAPLANPKVKTGFGMVTTVERFTQDLAALAELDALCRAKYAGLTDTETVWVDDVRKLPGTWCATAARRTELARTIAQTRTRELMDAELARADQLARPEVKSVHVVAGSWYKDLYGPGYDQVKGLVWTSQHVDLLTGGGKETLARVRAQLEAWYAPVGAVAPAVTSFLETYAARLAAVKPAVDAALPAPVFVAKVKDGTIEAAGKAGVEGKVLESGVMTRAWVVTTNALNVPIERVRIGAVLYQRGAYCIYRSYAYEQLAVNGKFSGKGSIHDFSDWMMRCK